MGCTHLIPRSKERGSLVENIAFVGSRSNLTKELLSEKWIHSLGALGCKWHPVFEKNKWTDYSNIDIIVAVRSFNQCTYINKPASKLINCWRASVPAILASESAFLAVRKSELDFLIVNSLDEAVNSVKRLKDAPELYLSMVENGLERVQEFSDERITECWMNFFHTYAFPQYEKLQKISEFQRRLLFLNRYINLKLDRIQKRISEFSLNRIQSGN